MATKMDICGIKRVFELLFACMILMLYYTDSIHAKSSDFHDLQNDENPNLKATVLVFGGNGFIGASTVEKLLRANYSVVIINRGNWYWDTETTVKPYVRHIKCDRMQSLQRCAGLQHYIWSLDAPVIFEALVDFSAYHGFQITETLRILSGKIKRYIYISSDSVYEVSSKSHTNPSREEDAVRPQSTILQEELNKKDDYGHRKLLCEEELHKQSQLKDGVPYIALRLPDVIGPRDNTKRWWIYQLWIRMADYLDRPLSVPRELKKRPLSFVYVDDVADVILDCIAGGPEILNQAFNLAQHETPNLVQVLHGIISVLDLEDIQIQEDDSDNAFRLFPSVKLGTVDTTKAVRMLNWNPTSWIDVMDKTVSFYEHAISNPAFDKEVKDVIRTMQEHFTKDPSSVIRAMKDIYGYSFNSAMHDEL